MSKALLNLSIFILGICLAFIFVYRRELQLATQHYFAVTAEAEAKVSILPEPKLPISAESNAKLTYANEQRALLERALSHTDRLDILFKAVDEGTLESLQLLRTEYLNLLPEYKEALLPKLKRRSLDNVLLRLTESDWLDWPNSQTGDGAGGPTEARLYIDDVTLVNAELGRYLETSAHLLHGMYLSMMSGLPYSLEEDLFYLLQNAEKILKHRRYAAVPARLLLDTGLVTDEGFRESIEDMRGRLWLLYLEKHPTDLGSQVKLIKGLNPTYSSPAVFEAFRSLLYRLSLEGTPKLRAELIPVLSQLEEPTLFASKDEEIRQALAECYVIGAVDSIEAGELPAAQDMLARSEATLPGLKAQGVIRRFIEAPRATPTVAVVEDKPVKVFKREKTVAASEDEPSTFTRLFSSDASQARRGLEQVMVLLIILAVFGLIVGRVFLAFLARRNVKPLPPITDTDELPIAQRKQISDELDFDSLDDFDDISEKDAINK